MSSSLLRSLVLRLARLALICPVGRFVVEELIGECVKPTVPRLPNTVTSMGKEGLKVIACGFSRSGTLSLALALDHLGFQCYHGAHVFYSDLGYADKMGHCKLWLQAASEANWDNWQQILQGYTAIADFPAAYFYKRLMAAYPNAKIVLNVRDPDQWYLSCVETILWWRNKLCTQVFRSNTFRKAMDVLWWQGQFEGKFEEKEFAINVYKSHVEEVKRMVPREKLLVYEVKDGWAPLCGFLQVDTPHIPFPHGNDSSTFRNRMNKRARAFIVFSAVYVGLLFCTLAVLLQLVLQV